MDLKQHWSRLGSRLTITALGGALAACVPGGAKLDTARSCEESGVTTSNPYDFQWEVKVEYARVVIDDVDVSNGNNVFFKSSSPSGEGVTTAHDSILVRDGRNYGDLYWDDDPVLARGTMYDMLGSAWDSGAADIRLEMHTKWRSAAFWNGFWSERQQKSCNLRFPGNALVDAFNDGRTLIIGEPALSDPDDAVVITPEDTECEWLTYARLSVEASWVPWVFDQTIEPVWESEGIRDSSGCNSLQSADAYDYTLQVNTANLIADDAALAAAGIDDIRPRALLTYWGAGYDEPYTERTASNVNGASGVEPFFDLTVGDHPTSPGIQLDHLDGSSEEHPVRLKIYQQGDSAEYVWADCQLTISQDRLLASVNRQAEVYPDDDDGVAIPMWLHLQLGEDMECDVADGLDQDAAAGPITVRLEAELKSSIMPAERLDYPQVHNGRSDVDEVLTPDEDAPVDSCHGDYVEPWLCDCDDISPNPYIYCVEGGGADIDANSDGVVDTDANADDPVGAQAAAECSASPSTCCGNEDLECCAGTICTPEDSACSVDAEQCCDSAGVDCCDPTLCEVEEVCEQTIEECCEADLAQAACCAEDYDPDTCEQACEMTEDDCCEDAEACCIDGFDESSCETEVECTANTQSECCANPEACCIASFSQDSCEAVCVGGDTQAECCAAPSQCCLDEFEPSTCATPPNVGDDDDASADDPTADDAEQEISGCACSGSDAASSRGTGLLLLAALGVFLGRRRRRT